MPTGSEQEGYGLDDMDDFDLLDATIDPNDVKSIKRVQRLQRDLAYEEAKISIKRIYAFATRPDDPLRIKE